MGSKLLFSDFTGVEDVFLLLVTDLLGESGCAPCSLNLCGEVTAPSSGELDIMFSTSTVINIRPVNNLGMEIVASSTIQAIQCFFRLPGYQAIEIVNFIHQAINMFLKPNRKTIMPCPLQLTKYAPSDQVIQVVCVS